MPGSRLAGSQGDTNRWGTKFFDASDKVPNRDSGHIRPISIQIDIEITALAWRDHFHDAYGHGPACCYALSRVWAHRRWTDSQIPASYSGEWDSLVLSQYGILKHIQSLCCESGSGLSLKTMNDARKVPSYLAASAEEVEDQPSRRSKELSRFFSIVKCPC